MSNFSYVKLLKPLSFGKVKEYNGQFIETKLLLFCIPIFSVFIITKPYREIKIPLNQISLRAYFVPLAFILGGFSFFGLAICISSYLNLKATNSFIDYLPFVVTMSLVITGFYFLYRKEKVDEYELIRRQIIQNSLGLNCLPEWLDQEKRIELFEKLPLPAEWLNNLEKNKISDFELYFTAIYFYSCINPSDRNKIQYEKLDRKLNIKKLNTSINHDKP